MEKNPFFIANEHNPSSPLCIDNYATRDRNYCFDSLYKKLDFDVSRAIEEEKILLK